ncbi:hypothetical protein RHMOL_Rhmol12G0210100 [Rhododendron molle]|uniref:Uncharacterized protein n=1 Tax=Rhododendron molle TaxID=49168 RepID=A0ACC0LLP6_RHOML|nr:hypothetical protein RHMOL_Rhmol12G0210100 [Rhododendron molle]
MIVLRFVGCMYLFEPDMVRCAMISFAFSDRWNASQNSYCSLLGNKLDAGVHSPSPLYGPCPRHAIFYVTNPAQQSIEGKSQRFVIVKWY